MFLEYLFVCLFVCEFKSVHDADALQLGMRLIPVFSDQLLNVRV